MPSSPARRRAVAFSTAKSSCLERSSSEGPLPTGRPDLPQRRRPWRTRHRDGSRGDPDPDRRAYLTTVLSPLPPSSGLPRAVPSEESELVRPGRARATPLLGFLDLDERLLDVEQEGRGLAIVHLPVQDAFAGSAQE